MPETPSVHAASQVVHGCMSPPLPSPSTRLSFLCWLGLEEAWARANQELILNDAQQNCFISPLVHAFGRL